MSREEILQFMPPEEVDKMLEMNPYRQSKWWFPTPHENFNKNYLIAWDKGKFFALEKLIDHMAAKGIPKALMVEYFRDVTNQPTFHLEIEPIQYPTN